MWSYVGAVLASILILFGFVAILLIWFAWPAISSLYSSHRTRLAITVVELLSALLAFGAKMVAEGDGHLVANIAACEGLFSLFLWKLVAWCGDRKLEEAIRIDVKDRNKLLRRLF